MVQAFQSLLSESGERRPNYNGLSVKALGGEDATLLEASFFEDEVFCALSNLSEDNAPGPDGFSLAFWHFSWIF